MARLRISPIQIFLVLLGLVFLAPAATARHDHLDIPVAKSKQYQGRQSLLPMPFYMKGESHPAVSETIENMKTDKRTRAVGREDEHACSIAFQSAIIQLQRRAQTVGANAVVDIVSVTSGTVTESVDSFRCAAGDIIANVALTGRAVKLAE